MKKLVLVGAAILTGALFLLKVTPYVNFNKADKTTDN